MVRILVVTQEPFAEAVRFYRTQGVVNIFPKEQFIIDVKNVFDLLSSEAWAWGKYDVVLCEKYWTNECATVIQIAKVYGAKIWIDVDDDKHNIPRYNRAGSSWSEELRKKDLALCQSADLLTVSTEALVRLYSPVQKNILLVRNAWNDYLHAEPSVIQPQGRPIKGAWRGGERHQGDLEEVRKPFGAALTNQAYSWKFYGALPPPWIEFSPEQYSKFSPLNVYWHQLRRDAPDWLFVPLSDNRFNRAKSDNAALEQNMIGGGGVIAPMYLPEFDRPGVIRYKDNAHLLQIWKDIEKNPELKMQTALAGQDYVREHRRLSFENQKRITAIKALL